MPNPMQPMSLSPEIQSYNQQPEQQQDPEQLFKEKFNQMAYNVLYSRFADMAPSVVTFKILSVDVDEGKGVGVFVLMHDQKPVYVPVILTDGKLKPMEMFYYKDLNIFLPLTPQWLDEVSKMSLNELGEGENLPKNVPQDVNIRDLVMPPTTTSGRIGLASVMDYDARRMFKEAEDHTLHIHPQFLNIMRTAPKPLLDGVKLAFARNPQLLQKFAANYGVRQLTEAMAAGYNRVNTQVKTASAPRGQVTVLGKNASSDQFNQVFGSKAGQAFAQMLKTGVAIQDTRSGITKVAVKTEGPAFLDSPGPSAGWFKLYFADGKPSVYLVIPLTRKDSSNKYPVEYTDGTNHKPSPLEYLVIDPAGKEIWTCNDVMGEKINLLTKDITGSRIYKLLNNDKGGGDTPTALSYGVFINSVPGRSMEATWPFDVKSSTTDDGITRLMDDDDKTYVVDSEPSRKKITYTHNGKTIFVPNTAKYLEIAKLKKGSPEASTYRQIRDLSRERKNSIIKDPKILLRWMNRILTETGATQVQVKSAGLKQWWIGTGPTAYYFAPALEKVANMYDVSTGDALGILLDAQKYGRSYSFILDGKTGSMVKQAFVKLGQPTQQVPQEQPVQYQGSSQGAPVMGGPGTPPGMQPMQGQEMDMSGGAPSVDPMTGQPAAPPPPPAMSPTDLAIGEAVQGLQHQNELMAQQNQAQMQQLQQTMEMQTQQNQQLTAMLQGIQQRAQEISSATGGMVPAGAEQSPMVAAQMIAPTPPEQEPPPPSPMMDEQGMNMSPDAVAQQIHPELVDQAQGLQDQGVFDTAAIAMLASAPILQDIVSAYLPNLEKAVDNLGRVLLTLWLKETETKESIGDEAFAQLEEKLRGVFKNIGEVVLELGQNATTVGDEAEKIQASMGGRPNR